MNAFHLQKPVEHASTGTGRDCAIETQQEVLSFLLKTMLASTVSWRSLFSLISKT